MTEIRGIFVEVLEGAGVDDTDATPIPYHPGTVIVSGTGSNGTGFLISDQHQVGDVVEIYCDVGGLTVYVPSGETIFVRGSSMSATTVRLRKLSATEWGAVS